MNDESPYEIDPNLRPFATDREWELLTTWAEVNSLTKASERLGVSVKRLQLAKKNVLEKAAKRGYAPEYPNYHTGGRVPPGFLLKGQSVLVNRDNKILQRWDKTKLEGLNPADAKHMPDPKKLKSLSTMTDAEGNVIQQWSREVATDAQREEHWRAFADELKRRVKPITEISWTKKNLLDDQMAGYPVGDFHLGMMSWKPETGGNWDMKIAEATMQRAITHLMLTTQTCKHALLAFLGDYFHYDSFESVTPTSRNLLDSDTRYPKMIRSGFRLMRFAIERAAKQHETVRVIIEPGNHDPSSMAFMAEMLSAYYENTPRISIDTSPKLYHYFRFGKVLIGTHHGHKMRMKDLPLKMAADRPDDWGQSQFRYWWTGHVHHSKTQVAVQSEDFSNVNVESFRILAPPDAWHSQEGYNPIQDMQSIILHAEYGTLARHVFNPMMLEGSK